MALTGILAVVTICGSHNNLQSQHAGVFPSCMNVTVNIGNSSLNLKLETASNLDTNLPVFTIHRDEGGHYDINTTTSQMIFHLYQDRDNGASFILASKMDEKGNTAKVLEGLIITKRRMFHVKGDFTTKLPRRRSVHADKFYLRFSVQELVYKATDYLENFDFPVNDVADTLVEELKLSQAEQESTDFYRRKRTVPEDVFVDVLAFADFGVYSEWLGRSNETSDEDIRQDALENIKQYYALVFNEMDLTYKSLTTLPFTIYVRLVGIIIAENASDSPWTENLRVNVTDKRRDEVDGYETLNDIRDWVRTTDILPFHDHIMFFTGYDLTKETDNGTSDRLLGRAFLGTTCSRSGYQTSLVEDIGNFHATLIGAHELGHGLSAQHDDDNSTTCNTTGRHIMYPYFSFVDTFSNCSANYFQSYERGPWSSGAKHRTRYQCLHKKATVINSTDVTQLMLGDLYDIDEQCRQRYGSGSRHCNSYRLKGNQKEVPCRKSFCHIPGRLCSDLQPARGTSCGVGKWCMDFKCESNGGVQEKEQGGTEFPAGRIVAIAVFVIVGFVYLGIFCKARHCTPLNCAYCNPDGTQLLWNSEKEEEEEGENRRETGV